MEDRSTAAAVHPHSAFEPETRPSQGLQVLRPSSVQATESESLIAQLTRLENGRQLFRLRTEMIQDCHRDALRATRPQDWVASRGRDGSVTAMIQSSGARLVGQIFGVEIFNVRPLDRDGCFEPRVVPLDDQGEFTLRAWCSARSHATGAFEEQIEASRSSKEKFLGRDSDEVGDSDHRSAVRTLLHTKAVRILCGMQNVPLEDLERAWEGTGKSIQQVTQGHGFGRAAERGAQRVAEAGVGDAARELLEEILRRVAGDESAAGDLLQEITSDPEKGFGGFRSGRQFTKAWQIKKAWAALRSHEVFGDHVGDREPGED